MQLEEIVTHTGGHFRTTDLSEWERSPAPGKWSKKEILGHLIDSALNNLQRFVRGTYEERFKIVYDQDKWVSARHHQDADLNDLVALWTLLNKDLVRVFRNYPPNRIKTECDTGKLSEEYHTMEFLAADYIVHLEHHLRQLF